MSNNLTEHEVLVKALHIESLSKEEQEERLNTVGVLVYEALVVRALEAMDDETTDAFEAFIETKPEPHKIIDFFKEKVPNFDLILDEEARRFV